MELVKRIGMILFGKDNNPKLTSSLNKVKEADQLTEAINNRLKEIKNKLEQKTVNQG